MLKLEPIERESGLTRQSFMLKYLTPMKPVVLTDLTSNWPARSHWTIGHFKENYGHLRVPVVSNNFSKPGRGYMTPDRVISFREFLEILESGPNDLRIFLWNIFRAAPELYNDFTFPDIMDGFVQELPFMFFGSEGSRVALHYDIDMSHIFLNQIHGRKRLLLFAHDQSRYLYRHPFTVASYIDLRNPDYTKYPALAQANGYEVILQPGETLFIPSGFWHYIEYVDGGYSISLRSYDSIPARMHGLANIARHYIIDKGMNRFMGPSWRRIKEQMAQRRAMEVLQTIKEGTNGYDIDTPRSRIHIMKHSNEWVVKEEGIEKPYFKCATQKDAVNSARFLKLKNFDVIIHKEDGTIEEWIKNNDANVKLPQ